MSLFRRLAVAAVLVAFAACTDFSKYTRQGTDLVTLYGPEAAQLLEGNQQYLNRAQALPDSTEGKDLTVTALTENQNRLMGIKTGLDKLPTDLDVLVKAGNAAEVQKFMSDKTDSTTQGIQASAKDLKDLSRKVGELESQVAAQKAAPPAEKFDRTLSSGYALKGEKMGLEAQLLSFIEDSAKPADKNTWFNFDRITFKTGSAEIDMDKSKDQLTNLAEIMKAYPKLKVKVGGYTDNQGTKDTNKKLSAQRAKSIAKALGTMKVAPARVSPEGYGAEHPVCPANDTEECRAQNRRIAVRVVTK